MNLRDCIVCGSEFAASSPEAVICPACASPPRATAEPELTQVALTPDPSPFGRGRSAAWQTGDLILDTYEVRQIFSGGGMGLVYRVHHRGWGIDLALKSPRAEIFTRPGGKENFVREAETWVDLGLHPHIVSCYYVRSIAETPGVFAEFVEGGSLKDWIEDRRLYAGGTQAALERILDIAIQFAWGLAYAHERGLVHQDVKPANVLMMVDEADQDHPIAKVSDFGLARARALAGEAAGVEGQGSILVSSGGYTPAYCSPEQRGGQPVTTKTDIWSWAVSVLEMFSGEVTWYSGAAAGEALEEYLRGGGQDTGIPPPGDLADLLRDCFQPQPERRPKDMLEAAARLQGVYSQATGHAYARKRPQAVELRADSLNNKALSLLDLGKADLARQAWEEGLKADPQHLEINYNFGYAQWLQAKITASNFLSGLRKLEPSQQEKIEYWRLLAWTLLEQGQRQAAEKICAAHPIQDEILRLLLDAENNPAGECLRDFEDEGGSVNCACFSPDGRSALSGSWNGDVKLWDVQTGKVARRFNGHKDRVESVCFSPDGRLALSAADDCTVRLWEVSSGQELKCFSGHERSVEAACFLPDGKSVLSASADMKVVLWDVARGKSIRRLSGHTAQVMTVAASPDGRQALTGSTDQTLRLWDLSSGKTIKKFTGHKGAVLSACFSADGGRAFSGSGDRTIRAWDLASGEEVARFEGHSDVVRTVSLSPDGRFLLSGGNDRSLRLWEAASGREIMSFEGQISFVVAACFSPDGRQALSAAIGLRLWQIQTPLQDWPRINPYPLVSKIKPVQQAAAERGRVDALLRKAEAASSQKLFGQVYLNLREAQTVPGFERDASILTRIFQNGLAGNGTRSGLREAWQHKVITDHTGDVVFVGYFPDGRRALSKAEDNSIRIWDVETDRPVYHYYGGWINEARSWCIAKDGRSVLSGCNDGTLRLWEAATGDVVHTYKGHENIIHSVCISPDGKQALSAGFDKTIRLWDLDTEAEIRRMVGHQEHISAACFTPDGRYAISGSWDGTLRSWELSSGREARRFTGQASPVRTVCASPDGRYVLSGGEDGTLRLWEIASGKEIRRCEGHSDFITTACFTPDGRYIFSSAADATLRLWDLSSGKELICLRGHTAPVTCAGFSPDGRFAVSGSRDQTIRYWEFDWEWKF